MPVARERSDFRPVQINGRTYRLGAPPSEQDDVLALTRKFVNKTGAEAAQVVLTEAELQGFALVYGRLTQVPRRTRSRLEAWREAHPQEVQNWRLGGFFNGPQDEAPGFVLRKPGLPPGAHVFVGHWPPPAAGPAPAAVAAAPPPPAPPVALAGGIVPPAAAAMAAGAVPLVPPVALPPLPPAPMVNLAAMQPLPPPAPPAWRGVVALLFLAAAVNLELQHEVDVSAISQPLTKLSA